MIILTDRNGLNMSITKIENVNNNVKVSIAKFKKNYQTSYEEKKFNKNDHNEINQFIIEKKS